MTSLFDPIRMLKQISNELLKQLFTRKREYLHIKWDELSETEIYPIVLYWETMPDAERRQLQVVLHDVHALGDERGLKVLAEEMARPALPRASLPAFQRRGLFLRLSRRLAG